MQYRRWGIAPPNTVHKLGLSKIDHDTLAADLMNNSPIREAPLFRLFPHRIPCSGCVQSANLQASQRPQLGHLKGALCTAQSARLGELGAPANLPHLAHSQLLLEKERQHPCWIATENAGQFNLIFRTYQQSRYAEPDLSINDLDIPLDCVIGATHAPLAFKRGYAGEILNPDVWIRRSFRSSESK